ncbi:MAG: UvrD-helicase domain-containing protein [Colwellia sp.]|nr:UvrD-helicase domain-containing protein [Colwellia sp.]
MQVLLYNDLNAKKITGFSKFKKAIETNNFAQADVKKVSDNLYRAKLSQKARLLFAIYQYQEQRYCLVLEYLPEHDYQKSRFLANKTQINEDKITNINLAEITPEPAVYLNQTQAHFYYLDKILSFDQQQQVIYDTPAPVVIIGSAGSGKTALMLEKMKQAVGDILYVSHSPYLVQSARNLYYANGYQNAHQEEVDFLSFREYIETIAVPDGREVTRQDFESWFNQQRYKNLAAHKLYEEFRGVLTGPSVESPWLKRPQYLALGVRQSLFSVDQRTAVYDVFEKYRRFMTEKKLYDTNIVSQQYLSKVVPRYDFVVVDEVQDITNTQLLLILKSLYQAGEFILCGDANQIVHPNFFSWSKVKSLFFKLDDLHHGDQALRILQANYRNSPLITEVANRILKLKHARFGSVDKESNFLVTSIGEQQGQLQLLADSEKVRQQLDASTSRSTKFAVIVMHPEQKLAASRIFSTPLVFSIQEAKGLEYDSIILFNFIAGEQDIFKEIARGVQVSDLDVSELNYARAKNKTDKSLEAYKFYINSLYVAITRSVHNLYVVETDLSHPLMALLDLARYTGELNLQKQESSLEEWQQEAHKLELQGKQQQAEHIRQHILKEKQVPWPVCDAEQANELYQSVQSQVNKKQQLLLLEYSLFHQDNAALNLLAEQGFNGALKARKNRQQAIKQIYKNHFMLYDLKQPKGVLRDIDNYGVDHRNRFNLTPLMTAGFIGNTTLVQVISERGADKALLANHGLNAWQMLLARLLTEHSSIHHIGELYDMLAPQAISVQVDGRLEKLDDHNMFGFLVNVFFSLWYDYLPTKISHGEAITAANLHKMLAKLPDTVLPPMKKKQAYISRYLSSNEVDRDDTRNKKLFKRLRRGHYILNPQLKIRQGETWLPLHQVLKLDHWQYPYPDYLVQPNEYQENLQEMKAYTENYFQYYKNWIVAQQ